MKEYSLGLGARRNGQDIPHGGVEGKVGVALQGVQEWNSGGGLGRNPKSRKHILKIRY